MAAAARRQLSSSSDATAADIDRLRRTLWTLESGLAGDCGAPLPLGIPAIDGALGGGLNCGALHEIAAVAETATAATTGFALALTTRAAPLHGASRNDESVSNLGRDRNLIWIAEDLSLAENGALYGPGLDGVGIAPERLITVAAACRRDVLWAMEEALRCRAVGVVIGEMRPHGIDQVATRRLALAAAAGGTLGLILRAAPDGAPSAAATRWIIGTSPSASRVAGDDGVGPPRVIAQLVRNRRGHLGAWILEWNSVEQCFELATHSEPVAGTAFDRPHRAAAR